MIENAQQLVDVVNTELKDILTGSSKLTRGAIYFEPGKVPFCQALKHFAASSTKENAEKLSPLAEQDFGTLFGNFVASRVNEFKTATFKATPEELAAPAPKVPFEQDLYSQLSTILQYTLGRTMDVRQIDRLTQDTNRLAGVIDRHINERARAQALEICKLLNEATQQGFAAIIADIDEIKSNMDLPMRRQRDIPHGPYDKRK
jgi:hypothetical protein